VTPATASTWAPQVGVDLTRGFGAGGSLRDEAYRNHHKPFGTFLKTNMDTLKSDHFSREYI